LLARVSRRLLAGTVLIAASILALVFGSSDPKPVYASSVAQFLKHPRHDILVRVEGTLVHGSLCKVQTPCEFRFRMADRSSPGASEASSSSPTLSVRYPSCVAPDTFREIPGSELFTLIEGELCATCHVFQASQILAKCPSVYPSTAEGMSPLRPLPVPDCAQ